jgi:hypothetical protein
MNITVETKLLKVLAAATLILTAAPAYSQDEVARITTACNASMRQMVFWCIAAGNAEGTITTRVEQESKCEKAKQLVDGHCYPVEVPVLACNSSLKEMEIWCAGKAKFNVTAVVAHCEQSQRNIRLFCYR